MKPRQTLYEMLGVAPGASLAELQAAYRREAGILETNRAGMRPEQLSEAGQLLRVAFNTLSDPVSRLGYDSRLAASSRSAVVTRALATVDPDAAPRSAEVRADALSLRADALSLRADALLMRAGLEAPGAAGGGVAQTIALGALTSLKRFTRAIGLLVLVCIVAFAATRFIVGDPLARSAAKEAKAREQTALQEYYQTYGVRPANMAELELLEADRRRKENQGANRNRDREQQERDARRFEEESRQRGREVSENLRRAEDEARRQAEWERERQAREDEMKRQAEQSRIEQERQQWREVLQR
jgi:curved DNA-binding protein CbpA